MAVLGALLVAAAVVGAAASVRLHGAYREALRELRDGERRLETGPARRLEDELRWYGEVGAATEGWRLPAGLAVLLAALGLGAGADALSTPLSRPDRVGVICALAALVPVAAAAVADGVRTERRVAAAARRSGLWPVRRLEDAVRTVAAATARARRAHLAWLRTGAADYPGAPLLARFRRRTHGRAEKRRVRAVHELARTAPVELAGVRPPPGYADGLRGLVALVTGPSDDDAWADAVAALSRAADLDLDRRTRWLAAAGACAELRDDPPARESAARWALEAAGRPAGPDTDLLPDVVAVEPLRPQTWESALRRARATAAAPPLLAAVTLRWAYALLPHSLDPAVAAAVEIMRDLPDPDGYLRQVRPGFEQLGATSAQLARLVPDWTARSRPTPADLPAGGGQAPR